MAQCLANGEKWKINKSFLSPIFYTRVEWFLSARIMTGGSDSDEEDGPLSRGRLTMQMSCVCAKMCNGRSTPRRQRTEKVKVASCASLRADRRKNRSHLFLRVGWTLSLSVIFSNFKKSYWKNSSSKNASRNVYIQWDEKPGTPRSCENRALMMRSSIK